MKPLSKNPFKICRKKLQNLKEEQEKILKENKDYSPSKALEIAKVKIDKENK